MHTIHVYRFQYKVENHLKNYPNLQLWDLFQGSQKQFRNSHGKGAISFQATEDLLYNRIKEISLLERLSEAALRICLSDENPGDPCKGSKHLASAEPACRSRSTPDGESNSSRRGNDGLGLTSEPACIESRKGLIKICIHVLQKFDRLVS